MNGSNYTGLSGFSFAELFAQEVENGVAVMTQGLLALERDPTEAQWLEALMRAAHSLKGAARIVDRDAAVQLTHIMEDRFVAAQHGHVVLTPEQIDILLLGVDLLARMGKVPEAEIPAWDAAHEPEVKAFIEALSKPVRSGTQPRLDEDDVPTPASLLGLVFEPEEEAVEVKEKTQESNGHPAPFSPPEPVPVTELPAPVPTPEPTPAPIAAAAPSPTPITRAASAANRAPAPETGDRSLRITADNLNRLMGLAGELVVTSRWSESFATDLLRLKKAQQELNRTLNGLRESLASVPLNDRSREQLEELRERNARCQEVLAGQLDEFDSFERGFSNLSSRLYREVLECRMRPFADGVQGFPRMVRDVARTLGKDVKFEILGENTTVDRDILERIEAPLSHLLRNSLDHGLEPPVVRRAIGKPETGSIKLEAYHNAGMLLITVTDDGAGIDVERVRNAIVVKKLTSEEVAADMSDAELLEFLFLPGFTMKQEVTEISGRGVGLDAVQMMVREVGGTVRVSSQLGVGTQFQLQLPLTLSVMRTLLVEIAGEPYAFPLARIARALKVPRTEIESLQGSQHFAFGGQQVGLVMGHQILDLGTNAGLPEELPVIILGDKTSYFGVVVDRFLREQELVVRPLDTRLGKVKDISAAALLPDRSPVLIIDVEDLIRSIEVIVSGDRLVTAGRQAATEEVQRIKRVLVVDDSLTVRELERKLLASRGYEVDVAVDGMDGWNTARAGQYDLVITDVDMPRMDGIELVSLLKKDPRLGSLPVMIVSYKDREEDRRRGLEAGADYYLTKSSFHDESLLQAVADLIGEAGE